MEDPRGLDRWQELTVLGPPMGSTVGVLGAVGPTRPEVVEGREWGRCARTQVCPDG